VGEHNADAEAPRRAANQHHEYLPPLAPDRATSDIKGKNSVIRMDTDQINQQRIPRDNPQLKTAPIARKARVSTAINRRFLFCVT
jgi:hypothetical protein